jgi:hypothetical protein
MSDENPRSELIRLRKAQRKAEQDEIYGGFSKVERAEYDDRGKRIRQLDRQLRTTATPAENAASDQKREWNKRSETDKHQGEGRQPYRTREQDSTDTFTDALKTARPKDDNPDEP